MAKIGLLLSGMACRAQKGALPPSPIPTHQELAWTQEGGGRGRGINLDGSVFHAPKWDLG